MTNVNTYSRYTTWHLIVTLYMCSITVSYQSTHLTLSKISLFFMAELQHPYTHTHTPTSLHNWLLIHPSLENLLIVINAEKTHCLSMTANFISFLSPSLTILFLTFSVNGGEVNGIPGCDLLANIWLHQRTWKDGTYQFISNHECCLHHEPQKSWNTDTYFQDSEKFQSNIPGREYESGKR